MTRKQIFSTNLRKRLFELHLTHEQAAALLNEKGEDVSVRAFRSWVYGDAWPSVGTMLVMVEAFDLDDIYLFCVKQRA